MRSLRARLNTAFALPTVVIVVVLVGVAYLAARQGMEDELAQRLESVGQVIAVDMSEGIDASQISRLDESSHRVRDRLQQRLIRARDATELSRIFIFDGEARALIDTEQQTGFGDRLYRILADQSEVATVFEQGQPTSGPLFRTDDGQFHKRAYAAITNDGEVVAAVGVEASATYFDMLTRFATILILLGAVGVAVVVFIGAWFSKVLSRPVGTLVEGAEKLADGDLETPIVADRRRSWAQSEELDFLMTSFEEMRQSIVERDRQMQMMLAGIAHEVRNPLGGMKLFCGLLREDLEGAESIDDRRTKLEMVGRIEREVAYLERVVEGFLDYARPGTVTLERIDGADFVAEVAEVVESDVEKAQCTLIVDIEDGLELTIDVGQMRRALINVIRNACQASNPKDPVVLNACSVDGRRRIEVIDQGCGIANEDIDDLCKPFYTNREKGSGLGLALTRQIVEDHNGTIEIESHPGEGTTVQMIFPFDDRVTTESGDEAGDAGAETSIPEGWLG